MKHVSLALLLLSLACSSGDGRVFRLPTAPTATPPPTASPPPSPVPPPTFTRPPLAEDYTTLTPGQRYTGRVSANPPECIGVPGWPCQYFRITAPANGALTVEVTYRVEQQPAGQGVDVSIEGPRGEFWADHFTPGEVSAVGAVLQGDLLQLVLWYTFPGLEFELIATFDSL